MLYNVAAMVYFNQPTYNVNEGTGPVQPVLVPTNPSSTDISVEVMGTNVSAFGKIKNMHTLCFHVVLNRCKR